MLPVIEATAAKVRNWFDQATGSYCPFDVRCLLLLLCWPLAYKIVSLDFSALGDLCARPALGRFAPQWLESAFNDSRCLLFEGMRTRWMQTLAAGLLILTPMKPSRWLLAPAVALVWLMDTGAFQYRFNMYTLSTPNALLLLVCLTPARFPRAPSWSLNPDPASRLIMLSCLTYVSAYYVLSGISKLTFSVNWINDVKIGNYYLVSYLWHGQTMPWPVDGIASFTSRSLLQYPLLDKAGAAIVLIEQLLWLAAPFSVKGRAQAAVFAALYHVAVALMTGIVFITWIPIALAVGIPFSSLARRFGKMPAQPVQRASASGRGSSAALAFALLFPPAAALLPVFAAPVPPFFNFRAFGWKYPAVAEMKPFYRVGYRDSQASSYAPLPLHHGGFIDFLHTGYLDTVFRVLIENRGSAPIQTLYGAHAVSLLTATRPRGANGWLLGRFKAPSHLLSDPGPRDFDHLRQFVILRGTPLPSINRRSALASWEVCGEVNLDRPEPGAVLLYESCVRAP
jgi:hypothetical protein